MKKGFFIGTIAVFVAWEVLDFLMHEVILGPAYEETANLWRTDMKMGLLIVVVLIAAAAFVYIYSEFVGNKGVGTGLKYGLVYGIGAGVSFAYGTYAVMEIPYSMALIWFLGTVVETMVAGYLCGILVKPDVAAEAA